MTKEQIIKYLEDENHHAIFNLMASGIADLDLHDAIYEHCTILTQYYYIKAFKIVSYDTGKESRFFSFATTSSKSQHGTKIVLRNVLKLYSDKSSDLSYSHPEADGLNQLSKFVDIARKSF